MGFTCKANVRFKGAQLACGDEFFQGVEACRVDPLPVLQALIGPCKHTVHVACIGPDERDGISMNCVRQHTFDRPKCDLETTLIRYSPPTHTRARARTVPCIGRTKSPSQTSPTTVFEFTHTQKKWGEGEWDIDGTYPTEPFSASNTITIPKKMS